MPTIIYGEQQTAERLGAIGSAVYDYEYPEGLDLRPGSRLHSRLVAEVMERVRESHGQMSKRWPGMEEIDRVLTVFIPLDKEERRAKARDPRKPVSTVMPITYALLDTMLTYLVSVHTPPYMRYQGVGPEDAARAILLERHVDLQMARFRGALACFIQWRDALAYGLGVASPVWFRRRVSQEVVKPIMTYDYLTGLPLPIGERRVMEERIQLEGNEIVNIDPYTYLPDPGAPAHEPNRGEYVGWIESTNRMSLLRREQESEEGLFNVRYLKHIRPCTSVYAHSSEQGRDRYAVSETAGRADSRNRVDVAWMICDIVPSEWGLSGSDAPEKWLFAVAGDSVLVAAQPLGLNHDMFPVAVCAPSFDGYTVSPISRLEVTMGLQKAADFFVNSRVREARTDIAGSYIVDPGMLYLADILNPGPLKLFRLTPNFWGAGKIQEAMTKLPPSNVTARHIPDANALMDIMMRASGATDPLQGIIRRGSERRTATEFEGVRQAASARQDLVAALIGMQGMYQLAYLMASQTQQFAERSEYVRVLGRWSDVLQREYGTEFVEVWPEDIASVNFDVVAWETPRAGRDDPAFWGQLFQILATTPNPVLQERIDIIQVFQHYARLLGVQNPESMIRAAAAAQQGPALARPQAVMPNEALLEEVRKGNMVPAQEYARAAAGG